MKKIIVDRWFLILLAAVLLVGLSVPQPFQEVSELTWLRYAVVAVVMFLMALPLEAGAIWRALRRPLAPMLACSINMGLTPLLAIGLVRAGVFPGWLGAGLLAAAVTPCTLASAAVWTRRAGGNDSVAILVTLITNGTCFLITPLWLFAALGRTVQISLGSMVWKLGLVVVLPMAAAQLIRLVGKIGPWATARKKVLGVFAQCGILTMVFFGAVQTGLKLRADDAQQLSFADVAIMIVAVVSVHLAALLFGLVSSRRIGLPREDGIAVAIAGSQKTLMVGLQVCLDLGITILPMVTYHVAQLLVDTLIADRMRGSRK